MKHEAHKFIKCLDEAEGLLEDYTSTTFPRFDPGLAYLLPEQLNLTLFEDLPGFKILGTQQKPLIRTVRHLSCTGGSVISKCLAAMPNVALLSEVNPLSRQHIVSSPRFSPTDLTSLAIYGNFPLIDELSNKIFSAEIKVIVKHTQSLGKHLLLREHSHADILSALEPFENGSIQNVLSEDYQLESILTVRHPVDSFLSLETNDWIEFMPNTFDEYCRRYLLFIGQNVQLSIYKYEDFVKNPQTEITQMCKSLKLPFSDDFIEVFDVSAVTGDSGRSSNDITKRARRKYDQVFIKEANKSKHYIKLCNLLNYSTSI